MRIYQFISVATKNVIAAMANPLDEIDRNKILCLSIEAMMEFNLNLFKYQITPIWVFDGPPSEIKLQCLVGRKDTKEKKILKIESMRDELADKNVLKLTEEEKDDFKKLLRQDTGMSKEEIAYIREILTALGICNITAKHDGEKMCSALNREGYVSGVWSKDTDNYPLGSPILITDFDGREGGIHMVEIVRLETILQTMNISHSFLVEWCIMCSCDFNKGIKGLGPAKTLKLLMQYGSIDNLPPNFDRSAFNHILCREAFSYEPSMIDPAILIVDWNSYMRNIGEIAAKFCTRNRYEHLNFRGF